MKKPCNTIACPYRIKGDGGRCGLTTYIYADCPHKESPTPKPPFCVNCKHCHKPQVQSGFDYAAVLLCTRLQTLGPACLVTGHRPTVGELLKCKEEREDSDGCADRCGPRGRFFEEKEKGQ